MIPGSNNGEWGLNMSRGAMFPAVKGFNGPMGSLHYPLPNIIEHPTGVMDKPYLGRAFGRRFGGTVYELTPGGVTTEAGWGFSNKAKRFGRRRSRSRKNKRPLAPFWSTSVGKKMAKDELKKRISKTTRKRLLAAIAQPTIRFRSRSRSRKSRRSRRSRCKGITQQGKRCKHKTNDHFCKHHTKRKTSRK